MNSKKNKLKNENKHPYDFTNKQLDDLRTAFEIFQEEQSGFITVEELKVALRAIGFEPKKNEIKKLLSEVKSNKENS